MQGRHCRLWRAWSGSEVAGCLPAFNGMLRQAENGRNEEPSLNRELCQEINETAAGKWIRFFFWIAKV